MSDRDFGEGQFYPSMEAVSADIRSYVAAGNIDAALAVIRAFVRDVIVDRRSVAKVFADATLDKWCAHIGAEVLAQISTDLPPEPTERVDCLILATEFYHIGGHTAVSRDLLATGQLGDRAAVLLTDALGTADPTVVADRFGSSIRLYVAPSGTLVDKLRWIIRKLIAIRPRKVILMNHHHDPVAIAAAQPRLADQFIFYHHADHQLCLGVTLAHTLHVDPHPMGFHNCRDRLGLRNNVYWPMAVEDLGPTSRPSGGSSETGLRTASSGSPNKFEADYTYRYAQIVPRIIAATGGEHVHIGNLSQSTLDEIRGALSDNGIDPQRFVHIPWVPSVWSALVQQRIDVYITSFPLGGGRAAIEAMGAGVPIIGHLSYVSPFFGGQDMLYPEAFLWQSPDDLIVHLRSIDRDQVGREAQTARAYYEEHYRPDALAAAIDAGENARPAPPLRKHVSDPMQSFLDDVRYALRDHLTALSIAPVLERLGRDDRAHAAEIEALHHAYLNELTSLITAFARDARGSIFNRG